MIDSRFSLAVPIIAACGDGTHLDEILKLFNICLHERM
jgi:hypothetical protein